jgi:hypothetical protein
MADKKLIDLLWYMVGEQHKTNHAMCWDFQKSAPVPVVASPISQYLNEVNRFLFSGGLQVDLTFALENDPRQDYLDKVIQANKFQSILESVWVTGAITGELLVHIRSQDSLYKFDWYDLTEFEYNKDLGCICIETLRTIKDKEYVFKLDLYSDRLVEYKLIESRFVTVNFDWSKFATEVPHSYGFIPAMVIKNCNSINSSRGTGEFNFAAAKVNAAIMMATFDGLENVHFFGSPVLASPDPDDTLSRIQKRVQVYQKEANEDGGSIDVLDFKPIKGEHLQLIEKLESNFNNLMGIKVNSEVKSSDMSSLALRILNASTISKAETKWETYVEDGFKPLFERVLLMAKMDGILPQVSLDNTDSYDLTITRKKPYFDSSPLERLQQLQVATAMVDLGVDRTVALKETIWAQYSIQQIEEKLRLNLEDV